jgi:curved DNA-binding protein CbpA
MAISSVLDPYAALGVAHDASPATVRSSYKKLMLQCHPDKVRGDETQRAEKAQQFQKVQEAYELLIDSRRRRKYDEELAKNRHHSPAAAQAAATAAAASPTSATNGSAQQQGSTKTPPTQTEEDVKQQKDRERQERHERRRRRHDDERRSREEASWNETDREARKAHQARYKAEQKEAGRSTHFERDRYKDEVPKQSSRHTYGSSSSSRYTTEGEPSTRNSSYERTPSSHVPPHAPPPPPTAESRVPPAPPSETETVRPGYEETRAAEEKKLEAVRRRTREAQGLPSGSTRSARSNSHEEDPLAAEFVRQQQAEQRIRAEAELREKEHERRERKARHKEAQEHLSERLGHPADIPPSTRSSGKMSSSPPGRRGSSTVSRDDYGATPPLKPMGPSGPTGPTGTAGLFSGSVPTTGFYSASPHASPLYPGVRRRHSVSSPSLEKQTSRLQRDQQTCDSGYSSPSPIDIPMTFEKKHISSNLNPNPTVRNADG